MNDLSVREEFIVKAQRWFKENISVFAIIFISGIYILYGIVTIDKTGKTIEQIIADGAISFLVGYTIKVLLNNQGITNGENSKNFISSLKLYDSALDKISDFQHYLPTYCDIENDAVLKRVQISILRQYNIKYEDFINNNLDYSKLDKQQKKAIKKARKVRIHLINESMLLSDSQVSLDLGRDLSVSKKKYLKSSNSKALIIMLLVAILFGYYGLDPDKGFNKMGAIWCAIQVAIYLALGSLQYFSGYTFIADTYRTSLVRKANHLEKFYKMFKENKKQFTEYGKEKEENADNRKLEEQIFTDGTKQSSWDKQLFERTEEQFNKSSNECPITKIQQSIKL